MARVIILSTRADTRSGVLYEADMFLGAVDGEESLAECVLRTVREFGIDIQDGDVMFFPDAHPDHRLVEVSGDWLVRARWVS